MQKKSERRHGIGRIATVLTVLSLLGGLATPSGAYERPRGQTWLDPVTDGRAGLENRLFDGVSISANGRWTAFTTDAALVGGDDNKLNDVYVHDAKNGGIELASRTPTGVPALGSSGLPSLSGNGRHVAFVSDAPNLVEGDTNGAADVFVYNRKNKQVTRASVDGDGNQASPLPLQGAIFPTSISATGRFVSFTSWASNLVPDDANEIADVFVRDRKTRSTRRVTVDSQGNEASTLGCTPDPGTGTFLLSFALFPDCAPISSISGNGRYVAFNSSAGNLVADDTNAVPDVFVHDLKTMNTERVSVASDGAQGRNPHLSQRNSTRWGSHLWGRRTISHDGRFVVFLSLFDNLVPNDTNYGGHPARSTDGADIFVYDRKTGRTERVSVEPDGREVKSASPAAWTEFLHPAISPDGRYVAFDTCGGDPPTYYADCAASPYVYDRVTGAVDAVHAPKKGEIAPDHFTFWDPSWIEVSRGGRYLTYRMAFRDNTDGRSCSGGINVCSATLRADRGNALGVPSIGDGGRPHPEAPDEEDLLCVVGDICVPPGTPISGTDDAHEAPAGRGAELFGASMALRPNHRDLYVRIELDRLPGPRGGLAGRPIAGDPNIVYGARFAIDGTDYELRGALDKLGSPIFGMFRCALTCVELTRLGGGYGTTGERIVFSLPLDEIGLENGGTLRDVLVFSALGNFHTGATKILDRVKIN